jgi:uncharacterized protein YbjT (DUF2867 family)/uncharacterized membrane protein
VRVLVLGGYGLIGLAVTRLLIARGVDVIGAGRRPDHGAAREPRARWVRLDLAAPPGDLQQTLGGVDAVINAAGALQDGGGDSLEAVHHTGVAAVLAASREAGVKRWIQISAAGVSPDASTAFFRTKAAGDEAVRMSGLAYAILRPGIVIGPDGYGGTVLMRAVAGAPVIQPVAHADSLIHPVSLDEVAHEAADHALAGDLKAIEMDLVAPQPVTFAELVAGLRARQGLPPARIIALPPVFASLAGLFGDLAARLGWNGPLRSTAMTVMSGGVTGDPSQRAKLGYPPLKSAEDILLDLHSSAQERAIALSLSVRMMIALTLAAFWIVSGAMGFVSADAARAVLTDAGMTSELAAAFVAGGSLADIALGLSVLIARTHRLALWGMIVLTLGYLSAASLVTPSLWLDPLGPLVKSVPAMVLALIALTYRSRE